jgi:hypothetical protein
MVTEHGVLGRETHPRAQSNKQWIMVGGKAYLEKEFKCSENVITLLKNFRDVCF